MAPRDACCSTPCGGADPSGPEMMPQWVIPAAIRRSILRYPSERSDGMRRRWSYVAILLGVLMMALLSACGDGKVRRVSEPAASIQQLTVHADGLWTLDVRL